MKHYTIVLTEETYYKLRDIKEKEIKNNNKPSTSYEDIIKKLLETVEYGN